MIKEEEFDIVGYIKKTCVCDKCFCEMLPTNIMLTCNPPLQGMKCPKCGKEEYIEESKLKSQVKILKKKEKE